MRPLPAAKAASRCAPGLRRTAIAIDRALKCSPTRTGAENAMKKNGDVSGARRAFYKGDYTVKGTLGRSLT